MPQQISAPTLDEVERLREIYHATLPDLPEEILCRECHQPKQLIRVNDRVAFWGHYDQAVHEQCIAKLTYKTSFMRNVSDMWGHWIKHNQAKIDLNDPDYHTKWETLHAKDADTFLHNPIELGKYDRTWLYEHLEPPVLDIGCGTAIDYAGFHERGKQYMGVDITPSFLAAAQKRGVPDTCLTLGDGRDLPFTDHEYTSGYLKDVLVHYFLKTKERADGYQFIDELLRVCEHAYIAWGYLLNEAGEIDVSFMPSAVPIDRYGDGFFYNTWDRALLEERYVLTHVDPATSITKVTKK